jgi:hypothetical protein
VNEIKEKTEAKKRTDRRIGTSNLVSVLLIKETHTDTSTATHVEIEVFGETLKEAYDTLKQVYNLQEVKE